MSHSSSSAALTTPDAGIFNVVVGTAGHIDHGKSSLVMALTGIDPDRLQEEKERGITIDLGFAPLELTNGSRVGIIDVPGHERFIKNMVAGATGIDFVILVIAADDGVMAQTREHLQIINLLGVPDGLVVITKTDLVEPTFVELVREEIIELAAGTPLEGKPVLPVSSKTGEGIEALRAALEDALAHLTRHPGSGPLRMPIQRVFAKEGFGTVVTGVPLGGRVAVGEQVAILPPDFRGRVKGLHAYKRKIEHGQAGHSTAINVTGIERQEVVRGMVAATPGIFKPTQRVTAHLVHLKDAPYPLKHRAPVRFHSGTVEIMGRVALLGGERLLPGEEGYIQIVLEEPTVLCPGDRFILRHQSPMVTLGGGLVLDNVDRRMRRDDEAVQEELAARRVCVGDSAALLSHILEHAGDARSTAQLCAEIGLLPEQVQALAAKLEKKKSLIALKANEVFVATSVFKELSKIAVQCLEAYFAEHPALGSIARPELKSRLEGALRREDLGGIAYFDDLLTLMGKREVVRCKENEVALAGRERKLTDEWAAYAQKLETALKGGGLKPSAPEALGAELGIPTKALREVLRYLVDTGRAVMITRDIFLHADPYAEAVRKVHALFTAQPERTMSDIREALELNRKYVVPLAEHLDAAGLTKRNGDVRVWCGPVSE